MQASPICATCKHIRLGQFCDAFPNGIPDEIFIAGLDHRQPVEGDHGIQYEEGMPMNQKQLFDDGPEPDSGRATIAPRPKRSGS